MTILTLRSGRNKKGQTRGLPLQIQLMNRLFSLKLDCNLNLTDIVSVIFVGET